MDKIIIGKVEHGSDGVISDEREITNGNFDDSIIFCLDIEWFMRNHDVRYLNKVGDFVANCINYYLDNENKSNNMNSQKHLLHLKGKPPIQISKVMSFRKNDYVFPDDDTEEDRHTIEFWLQYNVYVEWSWHEPDNRNECYDFLIEKLSNKLF